MKHKHLIFSILFVLAMLSDVKQSYSQFLAKLTVGYKGGINFSVPHNITSYTIISDINGNRNQNSYKVFSQNLAANYHFIIQYNFYKNIGIGIYPGFTTQKYRYFINYNWENAGGFTRNQTFNQKLNFITVPVLFRYEYPIKNVKLFIETGFNTGILINAYNNPVTETFEPITNRLLKSEDDAFTNTNNFRKFDFGIQANIGAYYQIKRFKLGVETGYTYDLNYQAIKNNRFINSDFWGSYYDIPDDVKISVWTIQLIAAFQLKCIQENIPARYKKITE